MYVYTYCLSKGGFSGVVLSAGMIAEVVLPMIMQILEV